MMEVLTDFDTALLKEIMAIEKELLDNHIEPHNATYREVQRRVNNSLNRLYKAKKIRVGETINDKYISVIYGEKTK